MDTKNGGEKRVKLKNHDNGGGEDRLSSLPDTLLVEILSLLSIKPAAATSVLSHRWRHLWTQLTRLEFRDIDFTTHTVRHILGQLTSPKITALDVGVDVEGDNLLNSVDCCLDHIRARNVEEIKILLPQEFEESVCLPNWVFECQSLVVLVSDSWVDIGFADGVYVGLPNLKKLRLWLRRESRTLLGTLFRSCPLLEHLSLVFDLRVADHFVDISCPNLEFLHLRMWQKIDIEFTINAPRLLNFQFWDYYELSVFKFVKNPTTLMKAYMYFEEDGSEDYELGEYANNVISKLFQGISCVRHLDLHNDTIMIFNYLKTMGDGAPIFHNLTHFETTLYGPTCWDDLLLSLWCFPKLEVLEVSIAYLDRYTDALRRMSWSALDSLAAPFLTKLKRVELHGLLGDENELKLLEYFLSNASALDSVVLRVIIIDKLKEICLWKEIKFCEALFRLPKSSSTCVIEFSGMYICASSNAFIDDKELTFRLLCTD